MLQDCFLYNIYFQKQKYYSCTTEVHLNKEDTVEFILTLPNKNDEKIFPQTCNIHYTVHVYSHRRRIYLEAKANTCSLFFGEYGGPLRLCSRQIDKVGPGQYNTYSLCHDKVSNVLYTVLYSSMVASWAANLEDTGMNLFETFKFFHGLLHHF